MAWLNHGYVKSYQPAHPLADSRGRVSDHRVVCWEACGSPVESPCHWCGWTLPWRTHLNPAWKHCVNVDHLNGDPSDNWAENLVPSCSWCNANREWLTERWPGRREQLAEAFKHIYPNDRPAPRTLFRIILGVDFEAITGKSDKRASHPFTIGVDW